MYLYLGKRMDFHKAYQAADANPDLPLFPQREALAVLAMARASLSPANLQNWANRGLVKLAENNPGRSGKRLYSLADLAKLHVMVKLTALGVAASSAATISVQLAEYVDEALRIEARYFAEKAKGNTLYGQNAVAIIYEDSGELKAKLEHDRFEWMKKYFSTFIGEAFKASLSSNKELQDLTKGKDLSQFVELPSEPDCSIRISISASVSAVKLALLDILKAQIDATLKGGDAS